MSAAEVCWVIAGAAWFVILALAVLHWRLGPRMPHRRPDSTFKKPPPRREAGRAAHVRRPPACDIAAGTPYYFEDGCGNVLQAVWSDSDIDHRRCSAGNVRVVT